MKSFSEFCESLGCPLKNIRWSWCALSANGRRAVFTLWSDEIKDRKVVLFPTTDRGPGEIPAEANLKAGAREVSEVARICERDPTVEALGILCTAQNVLASPRTRKKIDDRTVFRLRVVELDGRLVAELVERVTVQKLATAVPGR